VIAAGASRRHRAARHLVPFRPASPGSPKLACRGHTRLQDTVTSGIVVAVAAVGVAATCQVHNRLVQADAAETLLCATLAGTTLLGLVLFAALGWWWADPVAALAVAYFAVREGREAWHGELICDF
jgi:Zn-dependent protease